MAPVFNSSKSLYNFVVRERNGVKGLVDSGLSEVPKLYIQPINKRINKLDTKPCDMPPIDLSKLNGTEHDKVVDEIVRAAETLGFFQVVNHSVPLDLMESLKDSAHTFFNMPPEKKVVCGKSLKMRYETSFAPAKENVLEWKDYIVMEYSSDEDALQYWPNVCKFLDIKRNLKSSFERYKARFVGDDASQQVDIDCGDTFNPVVKPATIRSVLSIVLHTLKNCISTSNMFSTFFSK